MSRQDSKKNKLTDFHKAQLENHRTIFAGVEPIVTQDGKDQGYQSNVRAKKENKISRFITKLFRVSNKNSKKVVEDKSSKLDQHNNLDTKDAMEEKIKQMNSKEVLQFLNTDELQSLDAKDKSNVMVNIEEQIKNMDSKQILKFLNTDDLSAPSS